ncbi:MAG: carboxymuconolactone decarboxylase family protein [Clostridiaceae bacterium]|nr:carboxymuconolactone decarboxylase family protein [Clostridiaceae bacterium]
MLAVTEVNGCQACSYAHTKFALEEGMSAEEIKAILGGDIKDIPENEMLGILFAQHYADKKGKPSKESWQRLVDEYGQEAALIILAMIRMIQVGNIYGMAISALRDRFKGKASGKTTLIYEFSILIMILVYMPPAFLHATFDRIRKKPIISF